MLCLGAAFLPLESFTTLARLALVSFPSAGFLILKKISEKWEGALIGIIGGVIVKFFIIPQTIEIATSPEAATFPGLVYIMKLFMTGIIFVPLLGVGFLLNQELQKLE